MPRRDQASSETQSTHMALGQLLRHFPVGVGGRTCLANRYWDTLVTCPIHHSWDFSIQKRRSSTFRALWISQLRTYREVSHREQLAKILFLTLVLEITLFQSLPKIHDHRWESEQKLTALRCLKAPVLWPQSDKLTQNCVCFINPCINLLVPPSVTREYHTKVFELLHYLQCIAAYLWRTQIFWRDIIPRSSQCWCSFRLGRT